MLHDSLEAVVEGGYVLFLVMEGDDDGVFRHVFMILPSGDFEGASGGGRGATVG